MKRILLYHTTDICNNLVNDAVDMIAFYLRQRGVDVGFIDLTDDTDRLLGAYLREMSLGFDAALVFNSCGQHETLINGRRVFEQMSVPFFNWLLDHPCEHTIDIESTLPNYHIICLDRDHQRYAERYFPNLAGVHFIPLGGMTLNNNTPSTYSLEQYRDRPYKLIFTASYLPQNDRDQAILSLPEPARSIALDLVEYMLKHPSATMERSLKTIMEDRGTPIENDSIFRDYMYVTHIALWYVRSHIREKLIRHIAASGLEMDIFGANWENIPVCDHGNLHFHPPVSYLETIPLYEQSQLVLNTMPWFKDGLHDRIPTALLAGAGVLTDSSGYIDEIFTCSAKQQELILFDIADFEQSLGIIQDALSAPTKQLYEIAYAGQIKARTALSWQHRVDELLQIIYHENGT